jgi:site-specific recombinase XerD
MRQADERQPTEQPIRAETAQLYRDGLLISILAATAIRRRGFASLMLQSNVIRTGEEWRIVLRSAETKQKRDHEAPLGLSISKSIDRFLELFRPVFFRSDKHRALWPSRKGVPMTGNAIYDAICRRTKAYFGHSVNPHLFRDGAATFCALNAPESIGSASALLGHAGPKTLKHYNQAGSIIAGRRLVKVFWKRDLCRAGSFP